MLLEDALSIFVQLTRDHFLWVFCDTWIKPWEGQTWGQLALIMRYENSVDKCLLCFHSCLFSSKVIQAFIVIFLLPLSVMSECNFLSFKCYHCKIGLHWKCYVCGLPCRIHVCKLFSTGIFMLSFYLYNLCVSWITSAKHHEMKHKGISIYVQCTLIHILNKMQNCYYCLDGSSLKILILHPWATKRKQYHWNFEATLKHLKKSMRSRF